ncbi:peptidase G2 autoproteolytic cleavage domain-containing protein, partial [Ectobacillus funiculus]
VFKTISDASYSHAEGNSTSTGGLNGVHIMGKFGDANDLSYSWYLANGTSSTNKGIAAKILRTGAAFADIGWFGGGADYAEMFETVDGNPIDVGYFVTFDVGSEKIRKANKENDYILGITSANPVVLGDSAELRWEKKFLTDEWGRVRYHDVVIPAVKDAEGNIVVPEQTESQPMINPEWDPDKEYIPRSKRPEWVAVGLLGKLLVRDDGSCKPGQYCKPNDEGIATASNQGYRVMKRTGPNQILVLFYLK